MSDETGRRIDSIVGDGIAQGRSAVNIADDLTQLVRPSRRGVITRTPYGRPGSYDARRLARSEVTIAFGRSAKEAGITNPFVNRTFYNLSPAHKSDPGDICEAFAEQSEEQGGFAPEDVPTPALDTHPHCLCHLTHGTADTDLVVQMLRDGLMDVAPVMARAQQRMTPLMVEAMIAAVMGYSFFSYVTGEF
ncbi:unnamed protein product [marine sediment metagenome]|uniref:Uncharacterized protein n=1 Tax=marine sediment metagenome TaxID=412755 RepID=X0VFB0_9ZZZZ